MNTRIDYRIDTAAESEIASHLISCDADFVPPLSSRVEIRDYARKLFSNSRRFEAWSNGTLIAMLACYCNSGTSAFVTSVSVLKAWTGKGIAGELLKNCREYVKAQGLSSITLEVSNANIAALKLYEKCGFTAEISKEKVITMTLNLNEEESHGNYARLQQ